MVTLYKGHYYIFNTSTLHILIGIGKDSTSGIVFAGHLFYSHVNWLCNLFYVGRNEPSSKGFPHIAIIGIVCGAALVAVFIFAVIMIILRRLRPER